MTDRDRNVDHDHDHDHDEGDGHDHDHEHGHDDHDDVVGDVEHGHGRDDGEHGRTHVGHSHGLGSMSGGLRAGQRTALRIALGLNLVFLVAEVVGGLVFGSLALLADSAHMASDVGGLIIALIAAALSVRPATSRHSYGLQRSEVLGALLNAASLLAVTGWVLFAAVQRFADAPEIDAGPVIVVGLLGLAVNIVSAVVLARSAGQSLNMRGAYLHMLADAAGSVAVVVAGVASLFGADIVDPVASIVISFLVLWSAWGLMRAAIRVLLESTPEGLDPETVREMLLRDPDVEDVHHVHLWSLASDVPALSGHVMIRGEPDLHAAQQVGARLKQELATRFSITHATLELECHPCEPDGRPHHP